MGGLEVRMDWVPIVFITFKVLAFGTGMFLAIKWHYEQGKKNGRQIERRAVILTIAKAIAIFVALLAVLLFVVFTVAEHLGLT